MGSSNIKIFWKLNPRYSQNNKKFSVAGNAFLSIDWKYTVDLLPSICLSHHTTNGQFILKLEIAFYLLSALPWIHFCSREMTAPSQRWPRWAQLQSRLMTLSDCFLPFSVTVFFDANTHLPRPLPHTNRQHSLAAFAVPFPQQQGWHVERCCHWSGSHQWDSSSLSTGLHGVNRNAKRIGMG